jgi:hypothetical protein
VGVEATKPPLGTPLLLGHMVTVKHSLLIQLRYNDTHCSSTTAKLVHKAAACIQHHTHCASDKQSERRNQNKRKEENTFFLCQVCLQGNESLNRDHTKGVVVEEREMNLQIPWVQASTAL